VREGVTNVLRHSRASNCTIKLSLVDCMAEVAITDDGVGPSSDSRGNGLIGLAERAEALGGSLTSGPSGSSGFCVRVRVPA
jgi:two-component system sensor histidine kinase DesK